MKLAGSNRNPVDYSDPLTRFAYVYSYVAAHSCYVRDILVATKETKQLLGASHALYITCVGGGPGSEIVGLIQAGIKLGRKGKVVCWSLDREEAWAETWGDVGTQLDASEFDLMSNFRQLDVTNFGKPENFAKAFGANLFILSFFLSEIFSFHKSATNFFAAMIDGMPKGALVLYIDNNAESFTTLADQIFDASRFERVADGSERLLPSWDEQRSDLGDYLKKFNRSPKVQSDACYRLWRKR